MPRTKPKVLKSPKRKPDPDLALRKFVFEIMGHNDWAAEALISNMDKAFDWIKHGPPPLAKAKPELKVV